MSQQITINYLDNKINDLNLITDWSLRLEEIKKIKNEINTEKLNINNLLLTLDDKSINTKEYNINKIINNFSKSDLSKKIKYYQYLNHYIKNSEKELFD